ncbi:beta-galactosidase [Anaerosolibacter carboniphilus]|uniref:Beta-galactosidase n=1 Tax=Anaerosolibacter carboniphilus TaxID=1417629 RepID=A0A841KWF1_9FIRM|nr:beta-galactosidase [Anaerosolibacter carboniphilus]MBB6215252.1 beta-galactosidase [Anaerosolibacter carboniphilus]
MYLGVDYYPEHWDIEMMDDDMGRMVEMGANIIRIGEFAWHLMEREEGKYDFSFFDHVIEKAKGYGLKVMFGTPTATFPAWLAKKHPSILSQDEYGRTRVFGGRRQYCYNSEVYREYTKKIVDRLVTHYKDEEAIVAWQIDNEFGHEGSDQCYCDQCRQSFQSFLKKKYQDIDRLNEIYGTIFWGQTYNDFAEIPMPQPTITTHNPTLQLDWARFRSYTINDYGKLQIDLVRSLKGSHQEITHNFYGGFFEKAYDQNTMSENLDFVSYDNYPVWGGLKEPIKPAHIAMTHDYIRGLKNKNYWIVEELMGAQGHNVIGYLPRPNQAKMWAYQAIAHGCENMLFFRWRGMTRGAEQFCLGIIDQDNEDGRKYREVQSFMNDISHYETIIKSEIRADIAVLYDFDNIWSWYHQQQSSAFCFTDELMRLYAPFYALNAHLDVISTRKDFSGYKVLLVPVMQIIDEGLGQRLEAFIQNGGTIVFSFRAGIKDRNNNIHFGEIFPCKIRQLAGIRVKEAESLQSDQIVEIIGEGIHEGKSGTCTVWRDLIVPEAAEVLYRYNDKFYNENACVTENQYGSGKVFYIGGGVNVEILGDMARSIVMDNDIQFIDSPPGLEVYMRKCNEERWLFINNHTDEEIMYEGMKFEPYESRIVKN